MTLKLKHILSIAFIGAALAMPSPSSAQISLGDLKNFPSRSNNANQRTSRHNAGRNANSTRRNITNGLDSLLSRQNTTTNADRQQSTSRQADESLSQDATNQRAINYYNEGVALKAQGRHKDALNAFTEAANLGLAAAMNELGFMYFTEEFPFEDKAFEWFSKAAEQNDLAGIFNTAYCYINGFGTEVNSEEAFKLYRRGNDLGSNDAKYELAKCYHLGIGTEINDTIALQLFEELLVLEPDNMVALYYIGDIKATTFGDSSGIAALEQAAEGGNENAKQRLAEIRGASTVGTADDSPSSDNEIEPDTPNEKADPATNTTPEQTDSNQKNEKIEEG